MAYQIKRVPKYTEDLELVDEAGNVVHVLHVELDAGSVAKNLSEKYLDLVKHQQEIAGWRENLEGAPKEVLQAVEQTIADLIEAVFGEAGKKTIYEFYENRGVEIAQQILPFITSQVLPRIRELARKNRKNVLESYSRKKRRLFTN